MRALVLSGGGALGAFEAGAIKALWDEKVTFDLICGTSIGAINASFAAQAKIPELTALWHSIARQQPPLITYIDTVNRVSAFASDLDRIARFQIFKLPQLVLRWMQIGSKKALLELRGLVKPDAIQRILSQNLSFYDLHTSLIVPVTNLTYASSEAFYAFVGENCKAIESTFLAKENGSKFHALSHDNFVLAVRSSAAIPGLFEPVLMNLGSAGDKQFVDGGVANNVPASLVTKAGATEIVTIMLQPKPAAAPLYNTRNILEIAIASLTVMQQQLLEQDLQLVSADTGVSIKFIRPSSTLPLSLLEFNNQAAIDVAFDIGYAAAQQAM